MDFNDIIKSINIKPYIRDESTVIYCADNRNILPQIPDKSIDLCLTDPPYGINFINGGGRNVAGWRDKSHFCGDWDILKPNRECFNEIIRVSKEQIIWGGNYFTDMLRPSQQWLIWDKGQRDFTLADCEMAWSSQDKAVREFDYSRAIANKENGQHPTQKPVALMKWCIVIVPQSYLILDPYLGSGTTMVAAKQLGRKCIGIEISEKYCEIAAKRCSQSVMNLEIPQDNNSESIKQEEMIF